MTWKATIREGLYGPLKCYEMHHAEMTAMIWKAGKSRYVWSVRLSSNGSRRMPFLGPNLCIKRIGVCRSILNAALNGKRNAARINKRLVKHFGD